jgi:hypothetical protein
VNAVRAWRRTWGSRRVTLADADSPDPPAPLAGTGSAARAGCTCLIFRGETGPGAHLAGVPVSIRPVRAAATTG